MRIFFTRLSQILLLFLGFKCCLIAAVLLLRYSSYNVTAETEQKDYGIAAPHHNFVIAGSSNVRHNFDYVQLNALKNGYSYRSCASSAPYGLYLTIKNLRKQLQPNDVVVLDIPYSLYAPDQYVTSHAYVLGLMGLDDYKAVFQFSPLVLGGYLAQHSVFNVEVWRYWLATYRQYQQHNARHLVEDVRPPLLANQDFGDTYFHCTNAYLPERHFIADLNYQPEYLQKVKQNIQQTLQGYPIRFYMPEINAGNNGISLANRQMFANIFAPLNTFETAAYSNGCMFDQNYHLNHCGAVKNTANLIALLPNIVAK